MSLFISRAVQQAALPLHVLSRLSLHFLLFVPHTHKQYFGKRLKFRGIRSISKWVNITFPQYVRFSCELSIAGLFSLEDFATLSDVSKVCDVLTPVVSGKFTGFIEESKKAALIQQVN